MSGMFLGTNYSSLDHSKFLARGYIEDREDRTVQERGRKIKNVSVIKFLNKVEVLHLFPKNSAD